MSIQLIPSKRGTKVLVDDKHLKTIPKKYESIFLAVHKEIDYSQKRLLSKEFILLEQKFLFKKWLAKLATEDRCLYEMIKEATPVAGRKVITPKSERMEILLDNDIRINTTDLKFFNLFPHAKTAHLNY